jgi:Predicted phage phi-C31 gp36 major capsid-like protein
MARNTLEAWLPEEPTSTVITRLSQTSVAETSLKPQPMTTETKSFPRSAGMGVEVIPKGGAYGEDESLNDSILLTARKFGKALRIAEEDIDDSIADVLTTKKTDWVTSFGILLDNAVFAVTAAENGGSVPFTSIYRALGQANAATGYTAGANMLTAGVAFGQVTFTDTGDIVTFATPHGLAVGDVVTFGTITTTTGIVAGTKYYVRTVPSTTTVTLSATKNGAVLALTTDGSAASAVAKPNVASYENISDLASLVEEGGYHDASRALFVAHPSVKGKLRKLKDGEGNYIFTPNPRAGDPDTLFGYPLKWSNGLKTAATATSTPAGNALIVFGNTDFGYLGKRSGPESVVIDGRSGLSALTDETILKVRARRGFGVAHEKAWAVLEISA